MSASCEIHYIEDLRPLTGRDTRVGNYVSESDFTEFGSVERHNGVAVAASKRRKELFNDRHWLYGGATQVRLYRERLYDVIASQDMQIRLYHRDIEPASRTLRWS